MVGEVKTNNKHLINAPAGSGKTTHIRSLLKKIYLNEPQSKILCITYTNRAVEELKKDLCNTNIIVSTIHSYINNLLSPLYSSKEVIDLYWEIYGERIRNRIQNSEDENIRESNKYYIEQYGEINEEIVKENLISLSYGETSYTSLYRGRLSHDDLILFANRLIKKYPVLLKKISDKYNYIFIDEYQDTSAYILEIFYEAVKDKENVQLYLLGDKMQQIYENYDGSFEDKLNEFDNSDRLKTNYRSIGKIVSILNNIYNDKFFKQEPTKDNIGIVPDINPQVIISSNVNDCVDELQRKYSKVLTLYLMNKEKYEEIGASNLYNEYQHMEAYSHGRKYKGTDILSDMSNDNPDTLMRFLFTLNRIMKFYLNENYGMVIASCKKENNFFDNLQFKIRRHDDKKIIKNKFDAVKLVYEREGALIKDVIKSLEENSLISKDIKKEFEENEEYQKVFEIEFSEVKKLADYLSMPHVSTQHGVKGESHESVIFVSSDNSRTPNVRMYDFFDLWSKIDVSLSQFENTFYLYYKMVKDVEKEIGLKTGKLSAETHNNNQRNKDILVRYSKETLEKFKDDKIFNELYKHDFEEYLSKMNVASAKKIFNISKMEGVLSAYKLFYVGCSRARKNLIVLVDRSKIKNLHNFEKKVSDVGFSVLQK